MIFLNLFLIVGFEMINICILFRYFRRFVLGFYQAVGILFLGMIVLLFPICLGFIALFRIVFLLGCRMMIEGFFVFDRIILFGLLFLVQLFYSNHQVSNLIYLISLLLIL